MKNKMENKSVFSFIDQLKEGLTVHQKDCYGPLKWLIGMGGRATGRTYLMAVIAIEDAVNNPDTEIIMGDHCLLKAPIKHIRYPSPVNRYLLDMIRGIVSRADDRVKERFIFTEQGIVYTLRGREQPTLKHYGGVL